MRYATDYGFGELNSFPGCNQLVCSNHAFAYARGEGKGQIGHEERLKEAQRLGYDAILCTVRADNEVELHILRKHGWKKILEFHNRETSHDVELWAKVFYDKREVYNHSENYL